MNAPLGLALISDPFATQYCDLLGLNALFGSMITVCGP